MNPMDGFVIALILLAIFSPIYWVFNKLFGKKKQEEVVIKEKKENIKIPSVNEPIYIDYPEMPTSLRMRGVPGKWITVDDILNEGFDPDKFIAHFPKSLEAQVIECIVAQPINHCYMLKFVCVDDQIYFGSSLNEGENGRHGKAIDIGLWHTGKPISMSAYYDYEQHLFSGYSVDVGRPDPAVLAEIIKQYEHLKDAEIFL